MRLAAAVVLTVPLLLAGCGNGNGRVEQTETVVEFDPRDSSILVRPFTDYEIRAEWVPGFRLLMRRSFPESTRIERWTVVSADHEGVEIEYATIADDGSVEGEPSVSRSTWIELRDHAAFPIEHSTREWVSRETALGDFEGWLYRVTEPDAAVIREYFFVPELPGAPVQMRALEGDTVVFELEQTARLRPDPDGS
jgi:hypothetical protein